MTAEGAAGIVILRRGSIEESRHRVHAAVVEAGGRRVAECGEVARITFMRSAAKPFQALPLVEDGVVEALGIQPTELALACGSHNGEAEHVRTAERLLLRAGFDSGDLACGAHPPMAEGAAATLWRDGGEPGRIHNNCSGKHAGMLALVRHRGWDPRGYHAAGHPLQERMADEIARWTGIPRARLLEGVDGCGVVCFAVPLEAIARAMGAFVQAADAGDPGPASVLGAMTKHPRMVAGTGRLCTELIEATRGLVVAKVGAEGVYCAGVRGRGLGIALTVEDGAKRAAEVALLAILDQLELLDIEAWSRLERWKPARVRNTRGEPAAQLEPDLELRRVGATGVGDDESGPRADGVLSPSVRVLVSLSSALAAGDDERIRRVLLVAAGLEMDREVEECLLQAHLFVGFPRALNGFARWRALDPGAVRTGESGEDRELWKARGERLCREVYGSAYEGLRENIGHLHPAMDRWMVEEGYGKVLGRPGLATTTRELCVVAVLAVQEVGPQLYSHLRGALRVGCRPAEVEAALHLAIEGIDEGVGRGAFEVWRSVASRYRVGNQSDASDSDAREYIQ
ncbi:MAG: hypothetical protein EA351_11645 [Gemmatimonadales bacterium]|nr:MAG: hypothetical protein EA351_11645 [Gemmatimonadales bacterium]